MSDEELNENGLMNLLPNIPVPPVELLPFIFQQMQQQIVPNLDRWHPDHLGVNTGSYGPSCIKRVTKDIRKLLKSRPPGADVFTKDDDATRVEFLVRGQPGTPYDGGFFHFSVRVPPEYPQNPPRVVLRTTDNGHIRFNPNYYENGCVCLSILGTWPGGPWDSKYTLANVLHTLQYQLNKMPWDNEPGFDHTVPVEWKQLYNSYLKHATLRAAVCDQLDPTTSQLPVAMRRRAARHFVKDYERYLTRCDSLAQELDGKPMMNPYWNHASNIPFQFGLLRKRLIGLRALAQGCADQDVDEQEEDKCTGEAGATAYTAGDDAMQK